MLGIIVLILIFIAVVLIYSKVKKVGFLHALIKVPLIIFEFLLRESANNGKKMEREARRQGMYDKAEELKYKSENLKSVADNQVRNAKDKVDQHFDE